MLNKFKNIINYQALPTNSINYEQNSNNNDYNYSLTNKYNVFCDLGSWHGFYLLHQNDYDHNGFIGPMIIAQEYPINFGSFINNLKLYVNDKIVDFKKSLRNIYSLPGSLWITYDFDYFTIELCLIFISSRTSMINFNFKNKSNFEFKINVEFISEIYKKFKNNSESDDDENQYFKLDYKIETKDKYWLVDFKKQKSIWNYLFDGYEKMFFYYDTDVNNIIIKKEKSKNQIVINTNQLTVKPKKNINISTYQSYTFNQDELNNEISLIKQSNYNKLYKKNRNRWLTYINNLLSKNDTNKYSNIIVKSIQTLIGNWRSPAGSINYNGVVPSTTYHYFIGLWAWDSWKHAVALSYFDANLAIESIKAMFDYQILDNDKIRPQDSGMIIDAVFYNKNKLRGGSGGNWNERNSKPPLATWAVYEIYLRTKNLSFLKQMYPKLLKYHYWWVSNRCNNDKKILQYGATIDELNDINDSETIRLAASWESGMDKAPRFKNSKIIKHKSGYVIDQASVDLNSYYFYEKILLAKIAKKLNDDATCEKLLNEKEELFLNINQYFFDKQSGFFYDLDLSSNKLIKKDGMGIEGIIPLWSYACDENNAQLLIKKVLNENYFNSYVPFPTVSLSHKLFSSDEYWSGPVWLDQAMFSIAGIDRYGFSDDAIKLAEKIFNNLDGLDSDKPIRENYNPLTGKGLHTTNFSWSAASLIILYKEIIEKSFK